jgi:hypothetical protein
MCHGEEWEQYLIAQQREFERHKREQAEAESRQTSTTAPPRPAEAPKDEEPVPA